MRNSDRCIPGVKAPCPQTSLKTPRPNDMTVFVYTCAAYSYLTSHTQHALSRTFVFPHVQSTFRVLTSSNRLTFTGLFSSLFSATASFSSLSSLSSEWSLPKACEGLIPEACQQWAYLLRCPRPPDGICWVLSALFAPVPKKFRHF